MRHSAASVRACLSWSLRSVRRLLAVDESPTAVAAGSTFVLTSPFSLVPRGSMAQAVRWGPNHQAVEQRVSAVIGAGGGTLSLPGADFSMTIPAGALMEPTAITVVAKAGPHVVYDMFPHGLKFLQPVTAVQGLSTTAIYRTPNANFVRTAYLPDGNEQIRRDDFAAPSELQRGKTYFYGDQPIAERRSGFSTISRATFSSRRVDGSRR